MTVEIRRRARVLTGWVVFLPLTVALGVVGAVVAFFGTAVVTTKIPLLAFAGLALCFGIATAGGELTARFISRANRHRIALGIGFGTTFFVTIVSSVTIFKPLVPATGNRPIATPQEVRFWELPTGSRIAYRKIVASPGSGKAPVVYLHGGPGAGVVSVKEVVDAFSFPARLGRDVYLYDQIGGGLSGRLSDVSAYTVERNLADLQAIQKQIGAKTVVLIGESWGAELATLYLAAHPERVERLILVSPGNLYSDGWGDADPCDLKGRASPDVQAQFVFLKRPRLVAAALLAELNPRAAHAFLPDAEGDAFADRLLSLLFPGAVCDPDRLPRGRSFGFGLWSAIKVDEDDRKRTTRVDASLTEAKLPVLILRGSCDYCIPAVARQYEQLLPNAQLVEVEGAGHFVWLEKPDDLSRIAGAFLSRD